MKKSICFALALIAARLGAAGIPVLPAEQWRLEHGKDITPALCADGDVLCIGYEAVPARLEQYGNTAYRMSHLNLFLKNPVALDEKSSRVIYEVAGMQTGGSTEVLLLAVLRDAGGELFYYLPADYPHLKAGGKGWSCRMSPDFFAGEAGAATHDIYYIGGRVGNTRPKGKLEFLGFRLTVRQQYREGEPKHGTPFQGNLKIGAVRTGKTVLPWEPPFLYADSVFRAKGEYLFAVQIRDRFQGTPVSEFRQRVDFDPADASSARRKLIFPLGPDGNYWIDYQVTARNGQVLDGGSIRSQVLNNPDRTPVKPVDLNQPPPLGILRINPGMQSAGVYERSQPLEVKCRLFPKKTGTLKISWKLLGYEFDDVIDQGSRPLAVTELTPREITVAPKAPADRDAFRLVVEAVADGVVVDRQTYYLGYRTDLRRRHDRAGKMADRREIKKHAYFRTTYLPQENHKFRSEQEAVTHFREFLESSRTLAGDITIMIDLVDFEVLPGVFHFSTLDNWMDAAADYGCRLTVRFAHVDQYGPYRWPEYSRQFNYDGTVIDQHYYGAYAVADPVLTKLWLDAYRALHSRYRKHCAFQGYYVMMPGGEWAVVDKPWEGKIAGYSPVTAAGFRDYLRNRLKLTLEALNKRWGTQLGSFEDVTPPDPTLRTGDSPDLSMRWIDFCRFKGALDTEVWFARAIESIRSYDDDRLIIIYGTPDHFRRFDGKLDYTHNGGNHYGEDFGRYVDAWRQGGIGWITEPHHPHRWAAYGDPAQRGWVLDWSVWVMLTQAGGGGANLHVYYFPNPTLELTAHYGGEYALDRVEKFRPILNELHGLELLRPMPQVAVRQDPYTLWSRHRTTFRARLDDLKRWFELLKFDQVPYEVFDSSRAGNYKLYVPNLLDEVIAPETLNELDAMIRAGGRAVIGAHTGKFVPELGPEPFQLLKKLGIRSPAGKFEIRGKTVTAKAVAGNPLFAEGAEFVFQTGERFHKQLNSDKVRENFWLYPYRWIPETDYFGYYPGHTVTDGRVLATLEDGGCAMSLHKVGKGEVIVFWGTPDMSEGRLAGMMSRAAEWAGIENPLKGGMIPYVTEGKNAQLGRHYLLLYQEKTGVFRQKSLSVPDGSYFLDELVGDRKLGIYSGRELRTDGIALEWRTGDSPLKIIRMIPAGEIEANWKNLQREKENE